MLPQPKIEGVTPLPPTSLNGCRFHVDHFHLMGDVIGSFADGDYAVARYRTYVNSWLVYKVSLSPRGEWVGHFHSRISATRAEGPTTK